MNFIFVLLAKKEAIMKIKPYRPHTLSHITKVNDILEKMFS